MQPVTIKNNQYSNTLWLTQVCLCLFALMILWVAILSKFWFLLLLPVIGLALLANHRSIAQQSGLKLSMRSNGQLVLSELVIGQSVADNQISLNNNDDDMSVEIKAFWYLPQLLMLKLTAAHSNKPIYLTLFRSVLGPRDFSQLLVGLTQMNATQQNSHDHSK